MNRRRFLQMLGIGAATALVAPEMLLDPEKALWVPGQKTIFDVGAAFQVGDRITIGGVTGEFVVTSVPGNGNVFITPEWVTREAIRTLNKNMEFIKHIAFDQMYAKRPVEYALNFGTHTDATDAMRYALDRTFLKT